MLEACRCATFVNGCLNSDCDVVTFVARHGVYYRIMLSPIGRNSLFCCRLFGVLLSAIAHINKSFVWAHYHSQLSVSYCRTVHLLLELLFVKFGYLSVSCLGYLRLILPVLLTPFVSLDAWCFYGLCHILYFLYDFIIDNNNNISSYRTCIELGGVGRLWWVRTIRRHWETWESTAARWQRSDSAASRLGICRQPTAEPTLHPQQTTPWNDDHVLLPVLHKLHPPLYLSVGYSLA